MSYTASLNFDMVVTGNGMNKSFQPCPAVVMPTSPAGEQNITLTTGSSVDISVAFLFPDLVSATMVVVVPDPNTPGAGLIIKGIGGDSDLLTLTGGLPFVIPWSGTQFTIKNASGVNTTATIYIL